MTDSLYLPLMLNAINKIELIAFGYLLITAVVIGVAVYFKYKGR